MSSRRSIAFPLPLPQTTAFYVRVSATSDRKICYFPAERQSLSLNLLQFSKVTQFRLICIFSHLGFLLHFNLISYHDAVCCCLPLANILNMLHVYSSVCQTAPGHWVYRLHCRAEVWSVLTSPLLQQCNLGNSGGTPGIGQRGHIAPCERQWRQQLPKPGHDSRVLCPICLLV